MEVYDLIDRTTELLFSPFFREVGNPTRKKVTSKRQFIKFIEENNGKNDCFTSVYPLSNEIDKIFFDIDMDKDKGITFRDALKTAKQMYLWLVDNNYTVIPIASGKKGFHIYVLLQSKEYDEQNRQLANAAYYLMGESVGGSNGTIDRHCLGDVRRLVRIPNTLRPPENRTYCTYLPEDFTEMSVSEIQQYQKQPHDVTYIMRKFPTLDDFPEVLEDYNDQNRGHKTNRRNNIPDSIRQHLRLVCRPCLYEKITGQNPTHAVRLATTIDLLDLGYSVEEIVVMFSHLNWSDFDKDTTRYYVAHAKKRGYKPYNCDRLRRENIPDDCPFG